MRRAVLFFVALAAVIRLAAPGAGAVSTSACSAILVDADSGRVLYEENADERRLIASTTKLMTALVAVEQTAQLSQVVTVESEWLQTEGSSIYLQAGEQITMEALLYGLLLESGNDAAMVIAYVCAGGVEEFARLMNQKAGELGMSGSHFANPSGLDDEEHYSTARDMAALAAACLENETVAAICAARSATFGTRTFVNHNKLLSMYDGCVGMKTGYTQAAGRTLVSAASRDGQTLIAVTLGDPDDWDDHMALFDYGFAAYPAATLCQEGETAAAVPVLGSLVRFVPAVAAEGFCYPLKAGESVETRLECADVVEAPVLAGQTAGRLVFLLDGEEIGEVELRYARTVNRDLAPEGGLLQRLLSAIFGETVPTSGGGTGLV